ncbi:hypothetical protein K431DRAFT_62425 [Polychaeton citri CBS 116435]|uniref:Xylanolytic transcriptional activator regulatory domain-containing protein n=1 Tax=Polychaeton citri CBS 116435 TaxID=1314669 RepID=A0A9P4Q994_9PEZI|nr:hypothetical protein K431DRAFT_62425 [Polychaeton citri CBS 116435]
MAWNVGTAQLHGSNDELHPDRQTQQRQRQRHRHRHRQHDMAGRGRPGGRRALHHSGGCDAASRVPQDALRLPEKSLADALVAAYFAFVNPGFPVVDEDRFMPQYTTNDPDNPVSTLLLQAILLVGAHVACQGRQREAVKGVFLGRAKTLIDHGQEQNRTIVVQAALLLAWQVDSGGDVSADAYYWIGTATIIATGMGMHRDEDNTYEKRTWRRVFWLLFQWDTLVSMQCGRPQALHIEECDVQPLQPSDFDEELEEPFRL